MGSKQTSPPDGLNERSPEWHFKKFSEFTLLKGEIGEPSPHLAIVGYLTKDMHIHDKLWMLGLYAATYCLPSAQVIFDQYPLGLVWGKGREPLLKWLTKNWKGIVTRTERRCVRSPEKMADCLVSLADWIEHGYKPLTKLGTKESTENYDTVWESVEGIKYFGRYINIRFVEGLRRYCGVPARLYDIRSIGGWSPKKALVYLYPKYMDKLLLDNAEGNELTDELALELLDRVREKQPKVDEYILAAMLCEYKGAFEKRHQYPCWTLDQEPLLYDKVFNYWGEDIDKNLLWEARKAIFPKKVLGEIGNRWYGTRWDLAATLRDHGYNWSDLDFDYVTTLKSKNFAEPVEWK